MKNRRDFLADAASASIAAAFSTLLPVRSAFGQSAGAAATLSLHTDKILAHMPDDFVGLSYESSQLGDPNFFSPKNSGLIALFKLLSPNGVLRLGGNSSEFTWWKADAAAQEPTLQHPPGNTDANWMPHELVAITPAAIDNLADFLDATGWNLIYGLNLGSGTPQRDSEEAVYVYKAMGSRLLYFQIGNEPDLYHNSRNGLRPADYGFDAYLADWVTFANAVSDKLSDATFGGPDAAAMMEWALQFAPQAPQKKSGIVALTSHYYAEGPPDDPTMNIDRLLLRDPKLAANLPRIMDAARAANLPYRMSEGNSCYRGGKPGVSDAFASSLWAADYMLYLAQAGCVGVNLHGGGTKQIRAALGGHLPGESVATRPDAAATGSFYTPIAGDAANGFFPRPVFYGMMLASHFAGADIIANDFDPRGANATAYAAKTSDGFSVALFNKDAAQDLEIDLAFDGAAAGAKHARVWRLSGSALDATSGVTLASAQVKHDGSWSSAGEEKLSSRGGKLTVSLPHASGALVLLS
jgi:hypothetical protein